MDRSATDEIEIRHFFDSDFVWKVFYVFAALAIISVGISLAGRFLGHSIAMGGHTDDIRIAEVVIGNNVLATPRNMIRFEAARRDGVASRLDLYVRWPELGGYTDATRDDFNHAGAEKTIIFVSIAEKMMSRDMSGRYDPIYSALTQPSDRIAPAGLRVRDFTAKSGYMNEVLYVGERPGSTPYVARCLDGEVAAQSLAPCERDIEVGDGLSLSYRFPREMLPLWQQLDDGMKRLANWLLKTGG